MKLLLTLLSLWLGAALAKNRVKGFSSLESGGEREEIASTGELTLRNNNNMRRDLKGSKYTAPSPCESMKGYVLKSDVEEKSIVNDYGSAYKVDVYQQGKSQPVASLFQQVVYTNDPGTEGIATGVFAFNVNAAISYSGTFKQKASPITGGSGKYACATGQIVEGDTSGPRSWFTLNVCYLC